LDGGEAKTVDLRASQVAYRQNVWNTGTLAEGQHTVVISWDDENDPGFFISVDAFETDGSLIPVPPRPTRYQQDNSNLFYLGKWTQTSASQASGGTHKYIAANGSVTVSFDGTYLAWIGKRSSVYGKANVYVDGVSKGTVDLYSASTTYGKVWETGTLSSGRHTVTIAWARNTSSTTAVNVSVDAFDVLGTIVKAPPRFEQNTPALHYTGTWGPFNTSGASGGSYVRSSTNGASVTITFEGSYLVWIATRGLTLSKARVSLDGGTAQVIDLYRSAGVAYQQKVWNTGILPWGVHTVTITRDPNAAAGKFISVDAVELVGVLK
jgi:bacillopeptidase F